MKNSINEQFKMTQGAHSDNDTPSGFRNYAGVAQAGGTSLNMGEPLNYGTTALNKHEPGHEESTFDTVKNYVRNSRLNVRATRPNSDRTTESSRIFGPTDKEIAAAKLYREKNRKRQEKIDKIKAGNS